MQNLMLAAVLAAAGTATPRDEYHVVVSVGNICGQSCIDAVAQGLRSLGKVETKWDNKKTLFRLTVSGRLTPNQIRRAIPQAYEFRDATIEITGRVSKDGNAYTLSAHGQTFALRPNDAIKNGAGKTWIVTGRWTQPEKGPTVIDVTSAKEPK